MKKSFNIEDILGFSHAEKSIYSACKSGFLSVTDLAKKARLPRMTINDNLRALDRRGLLVKQKYGNRTIYNVRDIHEALKGKFLTGDHAGPTKLHLGRDHLIRTWGKIALSPSLTRVSLLQPEASLTQSLKKVPSRSLEKFHKEHLKRNIILDGIVSDGQYSSLKDNLSGVAFSSMKGRSIEVNSIPKQLFRGIPVEMLILPGVVYLNNWKNESSLEIREKGMIEFLQQLFDLCKLPAKRIYHNKLMESLLTE